MARDIWADIGTAVIDGVADLPKDTGPGMLGGVREEGAKIPDNLGRRSWQELREEERKKAQD
ncbi:hypothetical protein JOF41_004980 [Saccharothrix coeruleofusca]|uniref:hypothetical protein n=1 Tax=Saccharothrix coeruleofusca TaxID=33919 RepID=UPI001AE1AB8A|nr:hypothetical protein [Saccharothrix coeruleofusca]MBP2338802.1 hypothetical protein [Saccharothrix coeruleofusca]